MVIGTFMTMTLITYLRNSMAIVQFCRIVSFHVLVKEIFICYTLINYNNYFTVHCLRSHATVAGSMKLI